MSRDFAITLDWWDGYEFSVDFHQEGVADLTTDEAPPIGNGAGPSPTRLLAAAVGNCMSASLIYCLDRAGIHLEGMRTTVEGSIVRNERGRLRVESLRVRIEPGIDAKDLHRIDHCLDVFEDFCTVGESVRRGIDVSVEVAAPADGHLAGRAA
jgi:uncharacterized OsmC-like protein